MIYHWSGHPETRCLDCMSPQVLRLVSCICQKFRNHFIKSGEFAAFITVLDDFSMGLAADFEQRQIALRAADVSGQNHERLTPACRGWSLQAWLARHSFDA